MTRFIPFLLMLILFGSAFTGCLPEPDPVPAPPIPTATPGGPTATPPERDPVPFETSTPAATPDPRANGDATATPATTGETTSGTGASLSLEPGRYVYSTNNRVRDVATFDGKLWAATDGGVVVYDLASSEGHKYTNLDGLTNIAATAIENCADQLIVSLKEGGLMRYDAATDGWQSGEKAWGYVPPRTVYSMTCDASQGRLVIRGDGITVLTLADGTVQEFTEADGLMTSYGTPRLFARDGHIVVAFRGEGLSHIAPDGTLTTYSVENGNLPTNEINNALLAPDGSIWVGGKPGLLHLMEDGSWQTFAYENFGFFGPWEMTFTPDGTLWTDAEGALCGWDTAAGTCSTVTRYDENEGMFYPPSGGIQYLNSDADGHLFYGTLESGAVLGDGSQWTHYVMEDETPVGMVYDMAQGSDGTIWVLDGAGLYATDRNAAEWTKAPDLAGDHLAVGDDRAWVSSYYVFGDYDGSTSSLHMREEIPDMLNANILSIALDSKGRLWLGQENGLTIKEGTSYTAIGEAEGWAQGNVMSLVAIGDDMVVGGTKGLVRFADGSSEMEILSDGTFVSALAATSDGDLIVGTDQGVAYWRDGELRRDSAIKQSVNDIQTLPNGEIWVTTYYQGVGLLGLGGTDSSDGGLYHFDGSAWERLGPEEGLFRFAPIALLVDDAGTVWAGGEGGIVRFVP